MNASSESGLCATVMRSFSFTRRFYFAKCRVPFGADLGVPRGGSFFLDILIAERENDPKQICKKILFVPTRART